MKVLCNTVRKTTLYCLMSGPMRSFPRDITVMNNGGIIACGTPSELCNLPIIEDIFGVKIKQMQDGMYSYQYQ